jgi:hypothetical protein
MRKTVRSNEHDTTWDDEGGVGTRAFGGVVVKEATGGYGSCIFKELDLHGRGNMLHEYLFTEAILRPCIYLLRHR